MPHAGGGIFLHFVLVWFFLLVHCFHVCVAKVTVGCNRCHLADSEMFLLRHSLSNFNHPHQASETSSCDSLKKRMQPHCVMVAQTGSPPFSLCSGLLEKAAIKGSRCPTMIKLFYFPLWWRKIHKKGQLHTPHRASCHTGPPVGSCHLLAPNTFKKVVSQGMSMLLCASLSL